MGFQGDEKKIAIRIIGVCNDDILPSFVLHDSKVDRMCRVY